LFGYNLEKGYVADHGTLVASCADVGNEATAAAQLGKITNTLHVSRMCS